MRTFSIATGAVAAVVATALVVSASALAATSHSTKVIPFSAKYAGTATAKVTDNVADIAANGSGTGTLLGSSKIAGTAKGDASAQPCVPFQGPGTIVGAAGTKLLFTVVPTSQGCGDEAARSSASPARRRSPKASASSRTRRGRSSSRASTTAAPARSRSSSPAASPPEVSRREGGNQPHGSILTLAAVAVAAVTFTAAAPAADEIPFPANVSPTCSSPPRRSVRTAPRANFFKPGRRHRGTRSTASRARCSVRRTSSTSTSRSPASRTSS